MSIFSSSDFLMNDLLIFFKKISKLEFEFELEIRPIKY